ncbi:MAG TPA: argininosuccinate lyase [Gammaproteobacteria bacterium]|nr:argininosuccinate lyase [Gammaproteobacteria bacterium]
MNEQLKKPWGGRFSDATDRFVEEFTASVTFDKRLARYDIIGSIAHARMLAKVGVLSDAERDSIVNGLEMIQEEIDRDDFAWLVELEDVHMNIEARLTDRIGVVGKKLHTGRSRNDQVATDVRLFLRDQLDGVDTDLQQLIVVLLDVAEREAATIMPGFTHLQAAQPVTFGHHMHAWAEMLIRDRERFHDCRKRVNTLPLGAAALAGTTFPIDREYVAEQLGFERIARNSLDAVSDRDFVIEFNAAASLLMVHLSRMSEELVLWSSQQFDFITLSDSYCTGSSIMPQKKNPDVPELVRGKSGRVVGSLVNLLMLMKSQPLAYNKDNQEDKEPLFDAVDTIRSSLFAFTGMLGEMSVNGGNMLEATRRGFTTATDLADYLVRRGVPFRDAHEVVGKAVRLAMERGVDLAELKLPLLQELSTAIDESVYEVLTLEGSVSARNHLGGTNPQRVKQAVAALKQELAGESVAAGDAGGN